MGSIADELAEIMKKQEKVVAIIAADLFGELQTITPVDTGQLKGAWTLEKVQDGWLITNNMADYADIRLSAYEYNPEFGMIAGSKQYPLGVQPTIDKYKRKLEIELKKI